MGLLKNKVKMLVVDDFATMRRIIINLLKELGYTNFEQASDGVEALSIVKSKQIDFIVSDWNMPNMTGIDFLKAVRADTQLSEMPFLLVTAEAKRSQIFEAAEAGTDGYIVKPFTAETLKEKLNKIVERKQNYFLSKNLWA
jgi:two-component system, chemotaxis family, chemotaxis protein CheY